jgi:hypothetical protein
LGTCSLRVGKWVASASFRWHVRNLWWSNLTFCCISGSVTMFFSSWYGVWRYLMVGLLLMIISFISPSFLFLIKKYVRLSFLFLVFQFHFSFFWFLVFVLIVCIKVLFVFNSVFQLYFLICFFFILISVLLIFSFFLGFFYKSFIGFQFHHSIKIILFYFIQIDPHSFHLFFLLLKLFFNSI